MTGIELERKSYMNPLLCLTGRTILLVENEEEDLETYTGWLKNIGCHVISARSYHDGMEVLRDREKCNQIDMLLLDIELSKNGNEPDGWDLLNDARDSDINFDKPIVMLSRPYDKQEHIQYTVECGADGHIPKSTPEQSFQLWLEWICQVNRDTTQWLKSGALAINKEKNEVKWDGEIVEFIGDRQYELLRCLMRHPQKPLTYEFLGSNAFRKYLKKGTVQNTMAHLSRSISAFADFNHFVGNVRGDGYIFKQEVMGVDQC